MTQGKVISLKILIKWVIADLNQVKPVKEQRVDGSYLIIVIRVRYTLMDKEIYYQIKILSK